MTVIARWEETHMDTAEHARIEPWTLGLWGGSTTHCSTTIPNILLSLTTASAEFLLMCPWISISGHAYFILGSLGTDAFLMGGVKQEHNDGPGSKGFHHSDSTQEEVRILKGRKLLFSVMTSMLLIWFSICSTNATCPEQQFTQRTACKEAWLAQG